MTDWLLREVTLSPDPSTAVPRDLRIVAGRVTEIGHALPRRAERVVEGAGRALLPGLHDHHLHLNAMAARLRSVDLRPDATPDATAAGAALGLAAAAAPTGSWLRAFGYHESVAGDLDRDRIDAWVRDVPVRVQHRGGALWILNSAALERVAGVLDASTDVERDAAGRPNGRLCRYDRRLAPALPDTTEPIRSELARVSAELLALGVTGVTDATPDMDDAALELLEATAPLRIHLLGRNQVPGPDPRFSLGPRKIHLRDHDLPAPTALADLVAPAGLGANRRPDRARLAGCRRPGRPAAGSRGSCHHPARLPPLAG